MSTKKESLVHILNPSQNSDVKCIKLIKELRLSRIEEINGKVKYISLGFKENVENQPINYIIIKSVINLPNKYLT